LQKEIRPAKICLVCSYHSQQVVDSCFCSNFLEQQEYRQSLMRPILDWYFMYLYFKNWIFVLQTWKIRNKDPNWRSSTYISCSM